MAVRGRRVAIVEPDRFEVEDRKPFISVQANSVAECDGMRLEVQRETHGASDALFDVCVCTAQHFTLLLVVVSLSTSLLPYIVLQTVVRE